MTVLAYRTQPYSTTHENRIFDELLKELERVWEESPDLVILLGNFYCQGAEIDAAVLKSDSITVIDFKKFGGCIQFSENAPWLADGVPVRGGNSPNPFIQIRKNKFALLECLKRVQLPSDSRPEYGQISGLVIFHHPIAFDDRQLPHNIAPWFHVADFDHAVTRLAQITSRQIHLSNFDLKAIVAFLAIPQYVPVGEPLKAASPMEPDAELELPEALQAAMTQIEAFLDSTDRILVVTGILGTGLEQLLPAIVTKAIGQRRNCSVLAPNRRLASESIVEADSIYTTIYSSNLKLENNQFVYELAANTDSDNHLYILDDAHLVSDTLFESDGSRYGSGQLLNDFLTFVHFAKSQRQVILLGDRCQLSRGKADESALFAERLRALTGDHPRVIAIKYLLPQAQTDVFVQNACALAMQIQAGKFNQLQIDLDPDRCAQLPIEPSEQQQFLQTVLDENPIGTKFIAYSHLEVNRLNQWVRRQLLRRGETIALGDLVQVHSRFWVADEAGRQRPLYVPNHAFAEIMAIDDSVEPLVQPLKGREHPIVVPFLRVRARLLPQGKTIEFLCLKNYLHSEKPEVEPDTLLALQISARTRFAQAQRQNTESTQLADEMTGETGSTADSSRFAQFLRSDPFFNAARLRFGYALTLHRAQGQQFDTVIANLNTGHGQTSEAYFRWLYTLFTVVGDRLLLSEIPQITPLSKARWESSKGKLEAVPIQDQIGFDPEASAGRDPIAGMAIPEPALRNLYLHIAGVLKPFGIRMTHYKHHNYQEVYSFEAENNQDACTLRLHYNREYRVTQIETASSAPTEFADRIRQILTANVWIETEFQQQLYDLLREKLGRSNIAIRSIDHHAYQEVYYLTSNQGDVKLQIYYDQDGFVTRLSPMRYSASEVLEVVRRALEI